MGIRYQLRKDTKPSVVSKTLQVLRILGFADEVESQPVVQKRSSARANRSDIVSTAHASSPAHAPGHHHQPAAHEEVDLLGFGSLSLEPSAPVPQVVSQPNLYASPRSSAPVQVLPVQQQEVSVRVAVRTSFTFRCLSSDC